jgi:predicted porin
MKKALALGAFAVSSCGALAQTTFDNVSLYGLLDLGVHRASGIAGGTNHQLASGIMEGSRLGVRGSEDMGGGWRALFTLEQRLEANTGTFSNRPASGSQLPDRLSTAAALGLPAALQPAVTGVGAQIGSQLGVNLRNGAWDRQAFAGLVTPYGAILGGRQYTPAFEIIGGFDALQTQSGLAAGQVATLPAGVDIRADRALAYRIQQGPISASAMYAFGNSATSSSNDRIVGVQATYRTEAYSFGAGYNRKNNELGMKSLQTTAIGASAKLGPGDASVLFATVKDDNPSGLSTVSASLQSQGVAAALANQVQDAFIGALKQDAQLLHIGYKMTSGPSTVYVVYNRFDDSRASNADVQSYGVVYSHAFSKRTDVYSVLGRFANKGLGQAAPGGNGFLGGVTASAGKDSTHIALGLRHRF